MGKKVKTMVFSSPLSLRQVSDACRPYMSTFSNDFSSEAVRPKLLIFGINHPQVGGTKMLFFLFIRYVFPQKC